MKFHHLVPQLPPQTKFHFSQFYWVGVRNLSQCLSKRKPKILAWTDTTSEKIVLQ